ncbi:hypothetical protein SpCBS45565_g07647 [Spizellomyces sp. 'palustris']|nr:hypothetical protein SpCBS45565_g07647 [Spizellomyces sp. 'palustris']
MRVASASVCAVALLACSHPVVALTINRPGPSSTISPGQNVPIFATTDASTPANAVFNFCMIGDANQNNARVGGCGGAANAGSFNLADLQNGRVTANVPQGLAAGSYRILLGTAAAASCQAATCATIAAQGQPFAISASQNNNNPPSDPALDPRGFGITIDVPARVAAGTSVPIKILTDSRFDEATQFNGCTVVDSSGNNMGVCQAPGLSELTAAALRSGQVAFQPPSNMRGQAQIQLSVSSAGCRIDDNCFSDSVASKPFLLADPGAVPPPSSTVAPTATANPPAATSASQRSTASVPAATTSASRSAAKATNTATRSTTKPSSTGSAQGTQPASRTSGGSSLILGPSGSVYGEILGGFALVTLLAGLM